jgi:hypothetical protein
MKMNSKRRRGTGFKRWKLVTKLAAKLNKGALKSIIPVS